MSAGKDRQANKYSVRNKVRLIRGGKEYFDLLVQMINNTRKNIHLQYYIFLDDETGITVMNALKAAAQRGVKAFLHLDAYASQALPRHCVLEMRQAGVYVKWFNPFLKSKHFYFGRRLHHKVVVADGIHSLVGGSNVCNRYNDMPGAPAWLDMALYCEGEASLVVQRVCRQMWSNKKHLPPVDHERVEQFCNKIPVTERIHVRPRRNDWVKRKSEIWKSYLDMFSQSKERITIMCSYFLPGRLFRRKIAQAVRRGVKVKVILAGTSDIKVAKHAERFLYDWMLKNSIEIYEYQETVLHAKMAVYDGHWVTVGSYNVNNISAYASLEMNMDVSDKPFAVLTENKLEEIIKNHCKKITRENYAASTHFFRRIWQRLCYRFVNNVLNLFTFYFRQEE